MSSGGAEHQSLKIQLPGEVISAVFPGVHPQAIWDMNIFLLPTDPDRAALFTSIRDEALMLLKHGSDSLTMRQRFEVEVEASLTDIPTFYVKPFLRAFYDYVIAAIAEDPEGVTPIKALKLSRSFLPINMQDNVQLAWRTVQWCLSQCKGHSSSSYSMESDATLLDVMQQSDQCVNDFAPALRDQNVNAAKNVDTCTNPSAGFPQTREHQEKELEGSHQPTQKQWQLEQFHEAPPDTSAEEASPREENSRTGRNSLRVPTSRKGSVSGSDSMHFPHRTRKQSGTCCPLLNSQPRYPQARYPQATSSQARSSQARSSQARSFQASRFSDGSYDNWQSDVAVNQRLRQTLRDLGKAVHRYATQYMYNCPNRPPHILPTACQPMQEHHVLQPTFQPVSAPSCFPPSFHPMPAPPIYQVGPQLVSAPPLIQTGFQPVSAPPLFQPCPPSIPISSSPFAIPHSQPGFLVQQSPVPTMSATHVYVPSSTAAPEILVQHEPWNSPPQKVIIHKKIYPQPKILIDNSPSPSQPIIVHHQCDPPSPEIIIQEEPQKQSEIIIHKGRPPDNQIQDTSLQINQLQQATSVGSMGESMRGSMGESMVQESPLAALRRQNELLIREKESLERRLGLRLHQEGWNATEGGYRLQSINREKLQ